MICIINSSKLVSLLDDLRELNKKLVGSILRKAYWRSFYLQLFYFGCGFMISLENCHRYYVNWSCLKEWGVLCHLKFSTSLLTKFTSLVPKANFCYLSLSLIWNSARIQSTGASQFLLFLQFSCVLHVMFGKPASFFFFFF